MSQQQREAARKFRLEQDLRVLVPIARRQARKAGRAGICVENVRVAAENAGLQLASRERTYLSAVFSRVAIQAGLKRVKGQHVRTPRRGTLGGNLVALWRAA